MAAGLMSIAGPEEHERQRQAQNPVRQHAGDAGAERDARYRADQQEAEDLQVDIAHAEVAGAGEERQRYRVHDVGADEAPRRKRGVE